MQRIALALAAGLTASILAAAPVSAQQVELAIPAGTTVETGPEGDKVLFIGRPVAGVDAQDCADEGIIRMLQPVVLVDAGSGGRATRSDSVVALYVNGAPVTEGLANGTRIGGLRFPTHCTVGGAPYIRYSGTIE